MIRNRRSCRDWYNEPFQIPTTCSSTICHIHLNLFLVFLFTPHLYSLSSTYHYSAFSFNFIKSCICLQSLLYPRTKQYFVSYSYYYFVSLFQGSLYQTFFANTILYGGHNHMQRTPKQANLLVRNL